MMRVLRMIGISDRLISLFLATLVIALTCAHPIEVVAGEMHAAKLEDFLRLTEVNVIRTSPDGTLLVAEIRRPRDGSGPVVGGDSFGFERTDLWLIDVATHQVRAITTGGEDGSWHWDAIWSPDSQKLAFLSYVPGESPQWVIWHRETGKLAKLPISGRSVAIGVNFGSTGIWAPLGRVAAAWSDNRHLVTATQPDTNGADPFGSQVEFELTDPSGHMTPLWNRTLHGDASVTVWDSRNPSVCGTEALLMRLDVDTGRNETLIGGAIRAVSISPGGRYAAVIVATKTQGFRERSPFDQHALAFSNYNLDWPVDTALEVYDLLRTKYLGVVPTVRDLTFISSRRFPRWSSDETHLAIPTRSAEHLDRAYWIDLPTLKVWEFHAKSALDAEVLSAQFAVDKHSSPPRTEALRKREAFLGEEPIRGTINGSVVPIKRDRIGVFSKDTFTLLKGYQKVGVAVSNMTKVEIPSIGTLSAEDFAIGKSSDGRLWRINTEGSGKLKELPTPSPNSQLFSISPGGKSYVFVATERDGTYLWITHGEAAAKSDPILRLNRHLQRVETPNRILISFLSSSGQPMKALLLIPQSLSLGHPHAMVVDGYPARVVDDRAEELVTPNSFYNYPRHLLASAGYLVLVPTVPWPSGPGRDAIDLVTVPVLEAVQAAVKQGYADADRIGFFGHSYGGYMALALATRTDIFKAIVDSAGYSDLIAYHDTVLNALKTSECGATAARRAGVELEEGRGLFRMELPPWESGGIAQYVRNSPFFGLGSVRTPVLLIHGDQDAVSDANAERTYLALQRLGSPVQFARYWGEVHNFRSPGNIRDAWERTRGWFNEYLQ